MCSDQDFDKTGVNQSAKPSPMALLLDNTSDDLTRSER